VEDDDSWLQMSLTGADDNEPFISIVNDEAAAAVTIFDQIAKSTGRAVFLLSVAGTATSDIPGVSAAGQTPALRRLTPAADAELLLLGKVVSVKGVPRSPAGVIAPVVITRACAELLKWHVCVANCGTFLPPQTDVINVGTAPAKCVSTGAALDYAEVVRIFEKGIDVGKTIGKDFDFVVLAECVPAGTTTAFAVMTACGYEVDGLTSGSLPKIDHALRKLLVQDGLSRTKSNVLDHKNDPLLAVAAVGDPMQPFVAGVVIAASQKKPVILAGGSQMLAVHALARDIVRAKSGAQAHIKAVTVTTKWVLNDSAADVAKLSRLLTLPLASCHPDFSKSRHLGLRAYEDGHVKEGVGAGAAMALSSLFGHFSESQIMAKIDDTYDALVNGGK